MHNNKEQWSHSNSVKVNKNQQMFNLLAPDYLSFAASNNNQDFFNSSSNEKKNLPGRDWLNNSINLNSSMNLPPELR
jgi:hypothetical protein